MKRNTPYLRVVGDLPPGAGEADSAPSSSLRRAPWLTAQRLVWLSSGGLLVIGMIMLFSVSSAEGLFRAKSDATHYLAMQAATVVVGLVALLFLSRLDYRGLRPLILVAVLSSFVLLLAVHLPGVGRDAGGATRWVSLGHLSLQPSEVAKLAIIGAAAHFLSTRRARTGGSRALAWPLGLLVIPVCLLVLAQPDMGTALLISGVVLGLLFAAGMKLRCWVPLVLTSVSLGLGTILTIDYQRERLLGFLDPFADPLDKGYQVIQSLLALGRGGWSGVGPGRSIQKFTYLPEAHTDMIFAVLGEEYGFLGVGLVILLFGLFAAAGWRLATRCADPFGKYLAAGCTLLITGQAAVNVGGVLGVLPLTGVPLPFISFGRTNLVVVLCAVGVILSVARHGPARHATWQGNEAAARLAPALADAQAGGRLTRSSLQRNHPNARPANVARLDSRWRDRGPRGSRPRHS